jgi:predicted RND superfamily exporter protein
MTKLSQKLIRFYDACVLNRPLLVIVCLMVLIAVLGYKARDFKIDASSESLLLENDKDLRHARDVAQRYGANDYLIVSYTPKNGDLLSDANLKAIGSLRDELKQLPQVDSVMTLLDVPLLLDRVELNKSLFYRDLLVSRDMHTTALIVN